MTRHPAKLSKLSMLEWPYLTDEALKTIQELKRRGIKDMDLALELTIQILGEEETYEFEGD